MKHYRYDFVLFDDRKCGEGVAYNTMYTHISKAYRKNGIDGQWISRVEGMSISNPMCCNTNT